MGQRLVIEITENGEPLANAYYHWSAYTGKAARLTNDVLGYLDDADKEFTNKQKAVWALYMTGARFNEIEIFDMQNEGINKEEYGFVFDGEEVNRNKGLLSVSEKGMQDNRNWEESRVDIDIVNGEVYFGVIAIETVEDYKEWHNEQDDIQPDDLPVMDFSEELEFRPDEWPVFYETLNHLLSKRKWCAISSDRTTVYEFIE